MEPLVNIETGEINWDEIKKLSKESEVETPVKKFYCKKCNKCFHSKNYQGEYPLCISHRNNTFKKN